MINLPIEVLHERLVADFETGNLTWKASDTMPPSWIARYAGTPALARLSNHGYRGGKINRVPVKAHRVIWAMHYGEWPTGQIDHINGDRTDNRIANLRVVTNAENARNQKVRHDSKTGIAGVKFHKASNRYAASIKVNGKDIWLGTFPTIEEAALARRRAETEHGFSGRANALIGENRT